MRRIGLEDITTTGKINERRGRGKLREQKKKKIMDNLRRWYNRKLSTEHMKKKKNQGSRSMKK